MPARAMSPRRGAGAGGAGPEGAARRPRAGGGAGADAGAGDVAAAVAGAGGAGTDASDEPHAARRGNSENTTCFMDSDLVLTCDLQRFRARRRDRPAKPQGGAGTGPAGDGDAT